MIPQFPEFKKLELADKECFDKYTRALPPYSNHNFNSIFAWDFNDTVKCSVLNDNLVIELNCLITDTCHYTFAGNNKLNETALELIRYAKENNEIPCLKYIPAEIAEKLDKTIFSVFADEDNSDYVLEVSSFTDLDKLPRSFGVRSLIRRFINDYPGYEVKISSLSETDHNKLYQLFFTWAKNKQINIIDFPEYKAFSRYLHLKEDAIKVIIIYVEGKAAGFEIFEIVNKEYAMDEFNKADISYKGIFKMLEFEMCKYLNQQGVVYINVQADLGIKTLRAAKLGHCHDFMLHCYEVREKEK